MFYRDVLQQIRAWQPPAPKLPSERVDAETSEPNDVESKVGGQLDVGR